MPFTLTVPSDATPGDHTGGVLAAVTEQRTTTNGQRVNVDRRIAARVYLRVNGPLTSSLQIDRLSAAHDGPIVGNGTVTVTYRVRNTGNVRLRATAHVSARNPRPHQPGADHADAVDRFGNNRRICNPGILGEALILKEQCDEIARDRAADQRHEKLRFNRQTLVERQIASAAHGVECGERGGEMALCLRRDLPLQDAEREIELIFRQPDGLLFASANLELFA